MKLTNMSYLTELERRQITNFSETITPYPPEQTTIYIHIGGQNFKELEEALDCIYFDNKRSFNIVDIKKQPHLVSALVVMKSLKPHVQIF
jgi:hypothetical protein